MVTFHAWLDLARTVTGGRWQGSKGHTAKVLRGMQGCGWGFCLYCFLHDRTRTPACEGPCTSQGLQGQRKEHKTRHGPPPLGLGLELRACLELRRSVLCGLSAHGMPTSHPYLRYLRGTLLPESVWTWGGAVCHGDHAGTILDRCGDMHTTLDLARTGTCPLQTSVERRWQGRCLQSWAPAGQVSASQR